MKHATRAWGLALCFAALCALPCSLSAGPTKSSPFGIGLAVPVNLTPFNLGLGLSGKYWMNAVNAVDGTLFGGSGYVSLAGDYLWHRYYVFSGDAAKHLPLYFGPGASVTAWSAGPINGTAISVQGKLGVDYLFREPFDLYAEAIPSVSLTPSVNFYVGLSVGGRWYF